MIKGFKFDYNDNCFEMTQLLYYFQVSNLHACKDPV